MSKQQSRHVSLVIAGIALVLAGFAVGRASRPAEAHAQWGDNGNQNANRFGLAVPSSGFAVVKAPNGNAFVIDKSGMARRVLFSAAASSPDQPRQGSTEWLILN